MPHIDNPRREPGNTELQHLIHQVLADGKWRSIGQIRHHLPPITYRHLAAILTAGTHTTPPLWQRLDLGDRHMYATPHEPPSFTPRVLPDEHRRRTQRAMPTHPRRRRERTHDAPACPTPPPALDPPPTTTLSDLHIPPHLRSRPPRRSKRRSKAQRRAQHYRKQAHHHTHTTDGDGHLGDDPEHPGVA